MSTATYYAAFARALQTFNQRIYLKYESVQKRTMPTISVKYGMGKKAGEMRYRENEIRISGEFVDHASEDEIYNTIIHELCHFAADAIYDRRYIKAHGVHWGDLMRECGVRADRTHKVKFPTKRAPYEVYCQCNHFFCGPAKINRIEEYNKKENRPDFFCSSCKEYYKWRKHVFC